MSHSREANSKVHVGLIGCGGMGAANLANCAGHPDAVITGVCDVWKSRRDALLEKYKATAKPYHDYRELLARKDLDGVILATPPHWHALVAVHAAEAGKDFYLQKPMTIHLAETLAVKRAAERHGRITQIGTQIHAGANYRRVVEWVRSGALGKIGVVRTFLAGNQGAEGIGSAPFSDPPKDLDWNFWVGPARMGPCHPKIIESAGPNCSFMEYSGGYTPGMAPHIIDLPYWALNLGFPLVTSCVGGRYVIRDAGDAYDTQQVLWLYPDLVMTWMLSLVNSYSFDFQREGMARGLGAYFHGVNGTLYANYGTYGIVPEGDRMKGFPKPKESIPPSPGHEWEWIDSIKSREQPSCHVGYHYKIDAAIALANIACKLGRSIRFDPASERIVGDEEAARLARPQYREPWRFPDQYL